MEEIKKSKVTIVAHDGPFHADDVFACALLSLIFESEHSVTIVRTRDQAIIKQADYVVDVGGEYDPERNRFDHHQTGGAGVRANGIPYSSIGLVWKKFGPTFCKSQEIADIIEAKLIVPIDALDNGKNIDTPIYKDIYPVEIGDCILLFNPTWKESVDVLPERFAYVMNFAKEILKRQVIRRCDEQEGELKVLKIYQNTNDKRIIVFDRQYDSKHVLGKLPEPLISIAPRSQDDQWNIRVVRTDNTFTSSRILFPKAWAGLQDEDLEKITGVSGAVFCHNDLFFMAAKTKEAAIELAQIALKEAGE